MFDLSIPMIIAEVGLAHDGSLGMAHAYIDAVSTTKADAIKFQTHIAEAESSAEESFRVNFSYADSRRMDYWSRTAFTEEQWHGLKRHADEKGLMFLSSPFSIEAVELLERLDIPAWKIPSGEVRSLGMLKAIAATGKPVIISTGMSGYEETDAVVKRFFNLAPYHLAILQCTTSYPTPPEGVGLNVLAEYMTRYDCAIGLSDHSASIYPSLIATWIGAKVLEVHVTLSPHAFGPDVSSSLTVEGLTELVEGVQYVATMQMSPVDKTAVAADMAALRQLFGKSAFSKISLKAGDRISDSEVQFLKPGHGIKEEAFDRFWGRRIRRAIQAGTMLAEDDFDRE